LNWIPRTLAGFFARPDHCTSTPANFVLENAGATSSSGPNWNSTPTGITSP